MSDKVKIVEIAADIARNAKEVLEKAKELGLDVKNTTSSVSVEIAQILAEYVTTGVNRMPAPKAKTTKSSTKAQNTKSTKNTKNTKTTKTPAKSTKTTDKSSSDKPAKKDAKEPSAKESKPAKKPKPAQAPKEQDTPLESKQEVEFKKDSTLAQRNIGIRIVKKTASPVASQDTSSKKPQTYAPSIQELMGQNQDIDEPIRARKSKKSPKKAAVAHRGNEQKIELLDRDFGTHRSDYDEEQDEIMLFDFSEREIVDEDKENQERQAIADRVQFSAKILG